ncbi:hypothetical protein [Streptomyces sp. NPDC058872]|uniref:hypothetical protein n=1 Tax=Streptomyces sp. NPDC058872 TaxID=3346661 RepID=UPI00368918B2
MGNPSDDENDGQVTSITGDVLWNYAWKFDSLLQDFKDPGVGALESWGQGTGSAKILAGSEQLPSAVTVQKNFLGLCAALKTSLDAFHTIANYTNLDLQAVRENFQNSSDESVDVTEMWEILNSIQQDFSQGGKSGTPEK